MPADTTTIKVPKALRDRLNAIANQSGRGTTLADVLTDLITSREDAEHRDRMAYLEVVARAEEDPGAMARAQKLADKHIGYLHQRGAQQ